MRRSAQILLYRAADAALRCELLANGTVLVKRAANFLGSTTEGSVL